VKKILSLAYSTCPNDTFVFYALAHDRIDNTGFRFKIELKDVETLNQDAKNSLFDVSKLSFAAIGHLPETYGLLRSGAALGRGCGPLIVARPGFKLDQLHLKKIAVPGLWTTASLLLSLYLADQPQVMPMPFDRIMPAVSKGKLEAGVIIHEGRFTYQEHNLICLLDLGEWWEQKTGLPIPLGGIAIRRDIPPEAAKAVDELIKKSLTYAFNNQAAADEYIKKHAQEMVPDVIKQHIDLYVNKFTLELGEEGNTAIETLFRMAREREVMPVSDVPIFAY
jgi:1,4-dihydroxy-6-naphthoate synthase